jgi:hypothetical protein
MAKTPIQNQARVAALRALLFWEGEIRNSRIRTLFSLAAIQASRLLAAFRAANEKLLSPTRYGYALLPEAGESPPLEEYLRVLATDTQTPTWLEDGRFNFLEPSSKIFAPLRNACVRKTGVRIKYASMTTPAGGIRVIFPHTIVRLANRWHVRAWCQQRRDFRDFNLGRISSIEAIDEPSEYLAKHDAAWNDVVDIRLFPHRDLSSAQVEIIRTEYLGKTAARRLKSRGALVGYVVQALRAATNPAIEKPPAFQLEVVNVEELRKYLFPG